MKEPKRFYEMRGECYGHNLDDLWKQIEKVDETQAQAQEYAEDFSRNPQKYEQDVFLKRTLLLRISRFDEEIKKYNPLFRDKCHAGIIVFESDGKILSLDEFVDAFDEGKNLLMRCATCKTEIPRLKYPGWNE